MRGVSGNGGRSDREERGEAESEGGVNDMLDYTAKQLKAMIQHVVPIEILNQPSIQAI